MFGDDNVREAMTWATAHGTVVRCRTMEQAAAAIAATVPAMRGEPGPVSAALADRLVERLRRKWQPADAAILVALAPARRRNGVPLIGSMTFRVPDARPGPGAGALLLFENEAAVYAARDRMTAAMEQSADTAASAAPPTRTRSVERRPLRRDPAHLQARAGRERRP